ncbi:MAG TPA: SGNH/GDSL hydrolase family protein [Bryobacteraceae bacterium]|nr:SGNH/GDSL hydrolase family protein [Bryobacteraceae bacterium]
MITRRGFTWAFGAAAVWGQAETPAPDIDWIDARQLTIEGLGFKDLASPYDRLPARAEKTVRDVVWRLSRDSSGVVVRFMANTQAIHARWTVGNKTLTSAAMTAVASSGLDLYARDNAGKWRWLGIGRATKYPENVEPLATRIPVGDREYMVYLPLRNSVVSLELGVPKRSRIDKGPQRSGPKPLVFYGTSITHGAAASRPGMTHVAILGRMMNREVINLGFSGNGKMEPEVTKLVAELDASVYILDCLPNMTAKDINERAEACVKQLRAARPSTPILLVEDRNYADAFLNPQRAERNQTNHEAMRAVYAKLVKEKIPGLRYLRGEELLGDDGEATIDGSHPTDLGFMRQAIAFATAMKGL